jgi:hypothetical protein
MPIDNSQRRATADKAASQAMIDPLTYWEIMDEPNAQKYAKRLIDYTADPPGFLKDAEMEIFDRDAFVDIQLLKSGKIPPFREDLDKEYFDYINQWILSGNLESPKLDSNIKQTISSFIDAQLARGQKMLGMAATQLPTPGDVNTHNANVDAANAADAAAAKGLPPQPTPGATGPSATPPAPVAAPPANPPPIAVQ